MLRDHLDIRGWRERCVNQRLQPWHAVHLKQLVNAISLPRILVRLDQTYARVAVEASRGARSSSDGP